MHFNIKIKFLIKTNVAFVLESMNLHKRYAMVSQKCRKKGGKISMRMFYLQKCDTITVICDKTIFQSLFEISQTANHSIN